MKIITVLGTRPELIRLSRIIPKLDKTCEHILVHTGQNYDRRLNDIFFYDLMIRPVGYYMGAKGTMGEQIATILKESEKIFKKEKPDKVLILGDTNSGLAGIIAERMGIPVYHMEAGNRCYDKTVPEEVNRNIIDHISSYNFPYTPRSRENLIKEGIDRTKIITSGNPINEVLNYYRYNIEDSNILNKLKLESKKYFLATFHRAETVDIKERLEQIVKGLELVGKKYKIPVICSIHPRTLNKMIEFKINIKEILNDKNFVKFQEPFGFFDFVKLEKNALVTISDSGTVAEEACILGTPNIICRDTTERPETIEVGASILSGVNAENILRCTDIMIKKEYKWKQPEGYTDTNVSDKMIKYLMGRI